MATPVWIAHHDVHRKALRYDPEGGAFEQRSRAEAPGLVRGFYVEIPGGVAGLYATPEGPCFFLDQRRIPVAAITGMSVERGRRRNVFRLQSSVPPDVELSYAPPADIGVGDYSSESDRDFFVWLAESHGDPKLISYFTQAPPDPR